MRNKEYILQLPASGLFITATHYTSDCTEPAFSPETLSGSTVVLAHSYHDNQRKHDWETVISKLFDLCATPPDLLPRRWRVRDAWALYPHVYREPAAAHKDEHTAAEPLSLEEYATVLSHFVTKSKLVQGRNIIAVGDSESAAAWTIACSGKIVPSIRAVIFVEPIVQMQVVEYRHSLISRTVADPLAYRHTRTTTRSATGNKCAWKIWDERIFEAHLRHGLAEAQGALVASQELETSTTTTRSRDHARLDVPAVRSLNRRPCPSEQGDLLSSSTVALGGCGNLVVQDNPDGLARAILGILRSCERASAPAVVPGLPGKARL